MGWPVVFGLPPLRADISHLPSFFSFLPSRVVLGGVVWPLWPRWGSFLPPGAAPPLLSARVSLRGILGARRVVPRSQVATAGPSQGVRGVGPPRSTSRRAAPAGASPRAPKVRPLEDSRGVAVGRGRSGAVDYRRSPLAFHPAARREAPLEKMEAGDSRATEPAGQTNRGRQGAPTGRNAQRAAIATGASGAPATAAGGLSINPADRRLLRAPPPGRRGGGGRAGAPDGWGDLGRAGRRAPSTAGNNVAAIACVGR